MNIEGIPPSITPEFLQALATGLLALAACVGLLELLGSMWRHAVWQSAGFSIRTVGARLKIEPKARWAGWSIVTADVRVDWLGGLRGPCTRVTVGTTRLDHPGWLDAQQVDEAIRGVRSQRARGG